MFNFRWFFLYFSNHKNHDGVILVGVWASSASGICMYIGDFCSFWKRRLSIWFAWQSKLRLISVSLYSCASCLHKQGRRYWESKLSVATFLYSTPRSGSGWGLYFAFSPYNRTGVSETADVNQKSLWLHPQPKRPRNWTRVVSQSWLRYSTVRCFLPCVSWQSHN